MHSITMPFAPDRVGSDSRTGSPTPSSPLRRTSPPPPAPSSPPPPAFSPSSSAPSSPPPSGRPLGVHSSVQSESSITAKAKCATVTMMLAERVMRSDWSVDDEHFFETNTMNVWQTLEFLSGISLRKRYHYEGYNDTENVIRTLTPSWRRDSFVEKNAKTDEKSKTQTATANKYPTESTRNDGNRGPGGAGTGAGAGARGGGAGDGDGGDNGTPMAALLMQGANEAGGGRTKPKPVGWGKAQTEDGGGGLAAILGARSKTGQKRDAGRRRRKLQPSDLDPAYILSPADYADLIKCNFTLPRISARLERLMGTNVVRLTDRNYMKLLRERIDEDYRLQLQKRIMARELKEVERERLLILEGKTDSIPEELYDDPIFVVNKEANIEIQKQRSKLKTNRERNAERLKLQGVRWERERLQHMELESARVDEMRSRRTEQRELEQRYFEEDAERGMDLLRIENEDWRECEQSLKDFLERERAKMKERSLRIPTPYSSDPLDIQNIVRARQKFRETEHRIRHELEEKSKKPVERVHKKSIAQISPSRKRKTTVFDGPGGLAIGDTGSVDLSEAGEKFPVLRNSDDDSGSQMTIDETEMLIEQGSTLSESNRRHAAELQTEMEDEVQRGLLISKEQYDHLRYEDEKIVQLRQARDMRELYELAEEIIIGERIIEEEEEVEEEGGGELEEQSSAESSDTF